MDDTVGEDDVLSRANYSWIRRHTGYVLAVALFGVSFIGFLYTGIRSRNLSRIVTGLAYFVVFAVASTVVPDNEENGGPRGFLLILVWVASGVHYWLARREWFRWLARAEAARPGPRGPLASTTAAAASGGVGFSTSGRRDVTGERRRDDALTVVLAAVVFIVGLVTGVVFYLAPVVAIVALVRVLRR